MTQQGSLLEIHNLRFAYPDGTEALRGVNLRLEAGECVALLGGNGSGKTTLALHANGLMQREGVSRGQVFVDGLAVTQENLPRVRAAVGVVFQDPDEQLFMPTVLEDVMFGPRNQGLEPAEAEARARELLVEIGMGHAAGKAPYHLSAGEKRRVAIAGVLAMQPKLLVLDEPTTFLDPPAERELIALLRRLPQAKLLVTHNVGFARALASRAVFLKDGEIAGEGPVDEIVERFRWHGRDV